MFSVDEAPKSVSGFDPIPDGVYRLVILDAKVVQDEKSERFEIEFSHEEGAYRNRKHWARHAFKPGVAMKPETLKMNAAKLGDLFYACSQTGFKDLDGAHRVCSEMVGVSVYARVKNSEYQGKTYSNVEDYWRIDKTHRGNRAMPTPHADVDWNVQTSVPF